MRTTLELPEPLFARLKARAAHERVTLKQLLRRFVEQALEQPKAAAAECRSASTLPRVEGGLAIPAEQLSNADLAALLEE